VVVEVAADTEEAVDIVEDVVADEVS